MIKSLPKYPGYCINEVGEVFVTKKLRLTSKKTFLLKDKEGNRCDVAVTTLLKSAFPKLRKK